MESSVTKEQHENLKRMIHEDMVDLMHDRIIDWDDDMESEYGPYEEACKEVYDLTKEL